MVGYCRIRLEDYTCKATNEKCDRNHCVERVRTFPTEAYLRKMNGQIEHRRGDERMILKSKLDEEIILKHNLLTLLKKILKYK